jgi:hypothetical protein
VLASSSCLFYAAWAFKQSTICTLLGACLFLLLYNRNLRQAIQLAVPCACLMGLTVWVSGKNYSANAFVAMGLNPLSLSRVPAIAVPAILPSMFFWGFWIFALAVAPRVFSQRLYKDEPELVLLAFVVCVSVGVELIYLARDGCSRNSLLEGFIASATLSSCVLFKSTTSITGSARSRTVWVATALFLSMAVLPAAQLVASNRFGSIRLASAQQYTEKKRFAACLETAPKPLFTSDELFSLPWHSTGDTYPAIVLVWDVYASALSKGRIGGGVGELVAKRQLGSLLLEENDPLFSQALQTGYRRASTPSCSAWRTLRLLVRPTGPSGARTDQALVRVRRQPATGE